MNRGGGVGGRSWQRHNRGGRNSNRGRHGGGRGRWNNTSHQQRGRNYNARPQHYQKNNQGSNNNFAHDVIEEIGITRHSGASSIVSIAIEGCCHGALDTIYDRLQQHEEKAGYNIDLLICCGDFQSLRTVADFHSFAVPAKYRNMGTFYEYYTGEKVAPVLTIFIGGNHEASQPLQELYYGGWVAPNIYYLGAAGVINYKGIRIGGISGIYKSHDYAQSRYEKPPYDRSTMRSVYHYRNLEVYRLKCLQQQEEHKNQHRRRLDIMLSHDWPQGIEQYGNTASLLRSKPFFRQEIEQNSLGSPPAYELLRVLQPQYWFSAHLHVKFSASVRHDSNNVESNSNSVVATTKATTSLVPSQAIKSPEKVETQVNDNMGTDEGNTKTMTQFVAPESNQICPGSTPDLSDLMTQFLSLDKCLPRRQYLSILNLPVQQCEQLSDKLQYDIEWLAIVRKTHSLFVADKKYRVHPPKEIENVSDKEMEWVRERLGGNLDIPENFVTTVPGDGGGGNQNYNYLPPQLPMMGNPQTDQLLEMLQLDHLPNITIPYTNDIESSQKSNGTSQNIDTLCVDDDENEIDLDDDGDEQENEIKSMLDNDDKEGKETKKPRIEDR